MDNNDMTPLPDAAENYALRQERNRTREEVEELRRELERVRKAAAEMREALKPFAACDPSGMGSTPRNKIFLWKPSQTSKELPGISVANIDTAKAALSTDAGRDYHHRDEYKPLVEALEGALVTLEGRLYQKPQAGCPFLMWKQALADARQKGLIA